MDHKSAVEKVKKIFFDEGFFDKKDFEKELDLKKELYSDVGIDSLDTVELAMSLEEDFGVEITDDTLDNWKTVEDVVRWVEEQGND